MPPIAFDDPTASDPDGNGVPFEQALGGLIRQAERQGVDVCVPRDVDAVGPGSWTVEITKVEFDSRSREE